MLMAIYTVHQPPLKKYESAPDPDRFVFVRDGFSLWPMVFGPLWMLRHRMWLVLIGYIAVVVALYFALRFVGASGSTATVAGLLVALLIGIEAGTLRRFTLGRRRFRNLGVVVADDREMAERRFFDSWVKGETFHPSTHTPVAGSPTARRSPPPSSQDVIGLFPQSGAPR
jgi:Protein of unknown function (DUF2628)